jgi:hypothetical protein
VRLENAHVVRVFDKRKARSHRKPHNGGIHHEPDAPSRDQPGHPRRLQRFFDRWRDVAGDGGTFPVGDVHDGVVDGKAYDGDCNADDQRRHQLTRTHELEAVEIVQDEEKNHDRKQADKNADEKVHRVT